MALLLTAPVTLHLTSDRGWHVAELAYYGVSALLLVLAALLIISGRRDRRAGPPSRQENEEPR